MSSVWLLQRVAPVAVVTNVIRAPAHVHGCHAQQESLCWFRDTADGSLDYPLSAPPAVSLFGKVTLVVHDKLLACRCCTSTAGTQQGLAGSCSPAGVELQLHWFEAVECNCMSIPDWNRQPSASALDE
jgi:hypothetical protein